jgi:hypothetical protein
MQELDSIIARALRVAEFFDSIGQNLTSPVRLVLSALAASADIDFTRSVCKPNCKPTTRHRRTPGRTIQDDGIEIREPEHMVRYSVTRDGMRILELESRCAVLRTVGSNPTLSATGG